MCSVALRELIAESDKIVGLSSMTLIHCVIYSVVWFSVDWKPTVAEVLNVLLNLLQLAMSILSVTLTSCVSCSTYLYFLSYIAGMAAKLQNSYNVTELLGVHWFEDIPSDSTIVLYVSTDSVVCEAIRSRVLLSRWANTHFGYIEVHVMDNWADLLLELTTVRASHRDAPMQLICTLTWPESSTYIYWKLFLLLYTKRQFWHCVNDSFLQFLLTARVYISLKKK